MQQNTINCTHYLFFGNEGDDRSNHVEKSNHVDKSDISHMREVEISDFPTSVIMGIKYFST